MTTKEIKQVIEQRGYIKKYIYDSIIDTICYVYDSNDEKIGRCHVDAAERLRAENSNVKKWGNDYCTWYGDYRCKECVDFENREHCHSIAQECDDYANGLYYRCSYCGEVFKMPDDVGDWFRCPSCHEYNSPDYFEQLSIFDYLDDPLDWDFKINRFKEYSGISICVGWGGPNIYIDTNSQQVELYWGGSHESWPL